MLVGGGSSSLSPLPMPDGAVYDREIGDVIKQHRGHRERDASRLDGWQVAGLQTNSVQRADLYFRHSFEIGARQTRHAVPHRSSPFRSDRIRAASGSGLACI